MTALCLLMQRVNYALFRKEESMQDRKYLLSLKEVLSEEYEKEAKWEPLYIKALGLLDAERRKKLEHIKRGRKQLESIGAGLLLQLAVREAVAATESVQGNADTGNAGIEKLSFTGLLDRLEAREAAESMEALTYTYGPHGKPYLKNYPYYFSISHSGDYVFCVLSEQEVGADIQQKAEHVKERVLQRFFAEEEKDYWENCASEEEKRDFFYQMWCRKEAYGKLTGEGIADAVSVNMCDIRDDSTSMQYEMEEYTLQDGYQLAICKWV